MRLLVTADLHYNHRKSAGLADELIDRMNAAGGDVLLVVGDTAAADGDALERCLSRFRFDGPRLFVAGNHELWTQGPDSYSLWAEQLPRRVRALGWHWLEGDPFVLGNVAILGSVGWYDYSYAPDSLGIPRRFYELKLSPGAAQRFEEFRFLFDRSDDISEEARSIVARWNDGRHVKLHRSDESFLEELLERLEGQLSSLTPGSLAIVAVHHVPFEQLLPPRHGIQWDFAHAYLGSARIGQLLQRHRAVRYVICGHSHFPAEAQIAHIRAINIGSGYRQKAYRILELPVP